MGHVGTTSFFPSKNLGCYGDGGAMFTNDDVLAEKLRMIANHGMKVRYYHDSIGVNSRLDTIQAAVLNIKLKHLDTYIANRQRAAAYYDNAFANHPNITIPARDPKSTHVFHQYTLVLKGVDRAALQAKLQEKGIASMVYYPVPMHMQKAYTDPRYKEGDFPVTEELSSNVMSLPMHTELTEEQLAYIVKGVADSIQ
jgi:dTDP-4-amino-4,6-dideoxygalactose transaminase